jgi:ADP-ribose pyrophosphatase YjhB (NUDIX family)
MLVIKQASRQFVYRVAGVALHDGRVLLHRSERDSFWTLPGGRGEMLEPSPDTLRREMREETGLAVEVGRLLWVIENFYEEREFAWHVLGLYFLMSFPPDSPVWAHGNTFLGQEVFPQGYQLSLTFQWFPVDALDPVALQPAFLKAGLRQVPESVQHIIADSRSAAAT